MDDPIKKSRTFLDLVRLPLIYIPTTSDKSDLTTNFYNCSRSCAHVEIQVSLHLNYSGSTADVH